jgi:hypothetical protein
LQAKPKQRLKDRKMKMISIVFSRLEKISIAGLIILIMVYFSFASCGMRITWEPDNELSHPKYGSALDEEMLFDSMNEAIADLVTQSFPAGRIGLIQVINSPISELFNDQIYSTLKSSGKQVIKIQESKIKDYYGLFQSFLVCYPIIYGVKQEGSFPPPEKFVSSMQGGRKGFVKLYARLSDKNLKILWEKEIEASRITPQVYYFNPSPRRGARN